MTLYELNVEFKKMCASQKCSTCGWKDDNARCTLVYGYAQGRFHAIDDVFKILEEEIDIIDGASWSRLQDRLVKMKEWWNECMD